jgi:hypothetical protein
MVIHTRSRFAFTLALALGGALVARPAAAANITLDSTTCQTTFGGTWSLLGSVCVVQNFSLAAGDVLTVPSPRRLSLDGTCVNRGAVEIEAGANLYLAAGATLENRGSVLVYGNFDNYGEVENLAGGGVSVSEGSMLNEGEIVNSDAGTYRQLRRRHVPHEFQGADQQLRDYFESGRRRIHSQQHARLPEKSRRFARNPRW